MRRSRWILFLLATGLAVLPASGKVMRSWKRLIIFTAAALAVSWLFAPGPLQATSLEINSGTNIKTELFRPGTGFTPVIPVPLSFTFTLPDTATGDGLFEMFAGGDLNNITLDLISVTAGATPLGTLAFPIDPTDLSKCENPPHTNPSGCPVPETVPGGAFYDPNRGPAVGSVEGRRGVTFTSFGTAGLVVPQSLLVGGTNLTFNLTAATSIFDLYIDRLDLTYPSATAVPEPESLTLLGLGLFALFVFRNRTQGSRRAQ